MASFGQGFMNGMQTGQNMFYNSYKMGRLKEQNDANDAVPESLFGQQKQADLNEYDSGMQEVQNSGYIPNEEEANALEQGRQNLEEKKPSELFFNKVTGMGSQERMGHMMELFQASGGKVNDASFKTLQGVNQLFESTKKQDMDFEAQKQRQNLFKAQEKNYLAKAEASTGTQYSIVSEADKNRLGLPMDKTFQVDRNGKISQVGGSGVTINNGSKIPPAPSGYKYTYSPSDPSTPTGMVAIPGSPAEQEQAKANNEREAEYQSSVDTLDSTISTIDRILGHEGFNTATGMTSFMAVIPGTDAKDFSALVEQLKSQQFASQIKQMKGMGALSDSEGKKLSDAVSNLDLGQSPQQFKANLIMAKSIFNNAKGKMATKYADPTKTANYEIKEKKPDGTVIFADGSVYRP